MAMVKGSQQALKKAQNHEIPLQKREIAVVHIHNTCRVRGIRALACACTEHRLLVICMEVAGRSNGDMPTVAGGRSMYTQLYGRWSGIATKALV